MLAIQHPGIQSSKFLDINQIEHKFPQELKSFGFGVTLLHNHPHAQTGQVLLYSQDFKNARYVDRKVSQHHFPCSWYLEAGQVIAYEFTEASSEADLELIKEQLLKLEDLGYQHYGVTVRPIENVVEVETKEGHKYLQRETFKKKESWRESETAMNGKMMDACYAYSTCVRTFMEAHVTDYGHDVY